MTKIKPCLFGWGRPRFIFSSSGQASGVFRYKFCLGVMLLQVLQEIWSCDSSSGEMFLAWAVCILQLYSCYLVLLPNESHWSTSTLRNSFPLLFSIVEFVGCLPQTFVNNHAPAALISKHFSGSIHVWLIYFSLPIVVHYVLQMLQTCLPVPLSHILTFHYKMAVAWTMTIGEKKCLS